MTMTPGELELMIQEGAQLQVSGQLLRDNEGSLRLYYAGFNLTALAQHLSRELANYDEPLRTALVQIESSPQPHEDADRSEWKAAFFIASSLARSALASAQEKKAMRDWQPIETAPKDGGVVELNGPHPAYPTHGWWDKHEGEWAAEKMAYTLGPSRKIPAPSQWRPSADT